MAFVWFEQKFWNIFLYFSIFSLQINTNSILICVFLMRIRRI